MVERFGRIFGALGWMLLVLPLMAPALTVHAAPPPGIGARVEEALETVSDLDRPGQTGFATMWDGNKYIQCWRLADRRLRCEAAGALMQPSLARVLTSEKVAHLGQLGWKLDPSFGLYVQTFPASASLSDVASKLMQTLSEGYDADLAGLEFQTDWLATTPRPPRPPRNGYSQNLAGMINDAPAMAATAVYDCAYLPKSESAASPSDGSPASLISAYGQRVRAEIQRLRVNVERNVFLILDTDLGYVQCQPQTSPQAIYCEAESADSWPALTVVLTADHIAKLHAAGFADPGRTPNYSKTYPLQSVDARAIAEDLLTILHDAYGFTGASPLRISTESDPEPSPLDQTSGQPGGGR